MEPTTGPGRPQKIDCRRRDSSATRY